MKLPFWEFEWQRIPFDSLQVPLSVFRRPSSKFYSAFYSELFRKYQGFSELPSRWTTNKKETAIAISETIGDAGSVLSIGCGLGFLEKCILETKPSVVIDAFDFADTAKRWLLEIDGINCVTSIEEGKRYQFIYCSQFLYALNDRELRDFVDFVRKHLNVQGRFLTVDTSINPIENGVAHIGSEFTIKTKVIIKIFFRSVYYFFLKNSSLQLWGWKRNNNEIIKIFQKKGLQLNVKFSSAGQSFLIFRRIF